MMREIFFKWVYLGRDRETYNSYRTGLDIMNLKMMRLASAVLALAGVLMGVGFYLAMRDTARLVTALAVFAVMSFVFLRSRLLARKRALVSSKSVNGLISLMSVTLYAVGLYWGTAGTPDGSAVIMVWLFMFAPICFDVSPLRDAIAAIPCWILFIVMSFHFKNFPVAFGDAMQSTASLIVGLMISYRKASMALGSVIAESRLRQVNYALYHNSTVDELTDLPNRRRVFEQLDDIKRECQNEGGRLACLVMDLDDFKAYNDTYGHPAGDRLLRALGTALREIGEMNDLCVGRIGGEEFMAVWRAGADSREMAEKIRCTARNLNIEHKATKAGFATLSAGLCEVEPRHAGRAYQLADRALYRAKEDGKNVCYAYNAREKSFERITQYSQFGENDVK